MANKALGLIEVKGMLGAILAADAALKAANVQLLGNHSIRGGLTTVELLGDVAAIYAAVEAGVDSVKDMNVLISSHVIPRLDEQVERMLMRKYEEKKIILNENEKTNEEPEEKKEQSDRKNINVEIKPETLESLEAISVETPEEVIEEVLENEQGKAGKWSNRNEEEIPPESELEDWKVVELRSLAYQRNIDTLTKKEIKFANKSQLIRALLEKGVEDK